MEHSRYWKILFPSHIPALNLDMMRLATVCAVFFHEPQFAGTSVYLAFATAANPMPHTLVLCFKGEVSRETLGYWIDPLYSPDLSIKDGSDDVRYFCLSEAQWTTERDNVKRYNESIKLEQREVARYDD